MAGIKAVLTLNENGEAVIYGLAYNKETNNVSKSANSYTFKDYKSTSLEQNVGHIGLPIYGTIANAINSKGKLLKDGGYNGIMFGKTDSSKNYDLQLDLDGFNMFNVTFYFDDMAQQFPTEYQVIYYDGTSQNFTNNKNTITIMFQSAKGVQSVIFSKWNKANYNVSITYIELVSGEIVLTGNQIDTFTSEAVCTSDTSGIFYGCITSTGSIKLKDKDGLLFTYAKYGFLDENIFSMKLFMKKYLNSIQHHTSVDSPYFNDDNTIDFSLSNSINKWANITTGTKKISDSVFYCLLEILSFVYGDDIIKNFEDYIDVSKTIVVSQEIDESSKQFNEDYMTIKEYLNSFDYTGTLKNVSVQQAVNDICTAFQLWCYEGDNGKIVFDTARPKVLPSELADANVIKIPYYLQATTLSSTIIVANKYDSVIIKSSDKGLNNPANVGDNDFIDNSQNEYAYYSCEDTIRYNIINDYKANGIKNANVSIYLGNLYNLQGEKVKDWDRKGEILKIGDIVEVENKDGNSAITNNLIPTRFRVVGRKITYKGQPIMELDLQEVR